MCHRSIFALFIVIVLVDVTSAQNHVTIEQTNGYEDTWANMSTTCSLLGEGHSGNVFESMVYLDNIGDIRGTGWISAHVEREGSLLFLGCAYRYVQLYTAFRLEVTNDRISECTYACRSDDILLHRNYCYCGGSVSFNNSYCMASRCGNNEPLFCGQSQTAWSKCMCHYRYSSSNVTNNLMDGSCQNKQNNCTFSAQYKHSLLFPNITSWNITCQNGQHHQSCDSVWNGFVRRKVFYWETSPTPLSNRDYCVAVRRLETTSRLLLVSLPCSSKRTGICIKGTRISTTQQTTQTTQSSTVTLPTSPRIKVPTTDLTSHAISEHTIPVYTQETTEMTSYKTSELTRNGRSTNQLFTNDINIATTVSRNNFTTSTDGSKLAVTSQSPNEATPDDQTNSTIVAILGGVVTFVVLPIIGVVIFHFLVKNRRRNADDRSQVLSTFPARRETQHQYINCVDGNQEGDEQIHGVESGRYESLQTRTDTKNTVYDSLDRTSGSGDMYESIQVRTDTKNTVHDSLDHTSGPGDNMYESLQTRTDTKNTVYDSLDHTSGPADNMYEPLNQDR